MRRVSLRVVIVLLGGVLLLPVTGAPASADGGTAQSGPPRCCV